MRSTAIVTTLVVTLALACDSADKSKPATANAGVAAKKEPAPEKAEPAKIVPASAAPTKREPAKVEPAPIEPAKNVAPAPSTTDDAARQIGAFLSEPTKAPAPAFVGATAEIELREFCGACDGKDAKTPKTSKVAGLDALAQRAKALAESAPAEVLSAEATISCKKDCCKFVPDADLGVGDNVVNLESVCFALDAGGKPTAVTRIDVSGSW